MTPYMQLYRVARRAVLAYVLVNILLQLNNLKSYFNMPNEAKTPAQ